MFDIHENCLPADNSHDTSSIIGFKKKETQFENVVCCKILFWS